MDFLESFNQHLQLTLDKYYPHSSRLHQAIRYALTRKGKQIRPQLVWLSAASFGQTNPESILPAATAIEFIHTYSLIHDDLPCMDDDHLRRGEKTLHIAFDEHTALLAGDGLLTDSIQLIVAAATLTHEQKVRLVSMITEAAGSSGMVLGQSLDMDATQETFSKELLDEIHQKKTGLLLGAACAAGAICAGASEETTNAFYRYGITLGTAYQITDDLLDDGSTPNLGKTPGKDLQQEKLTYLRLMSREEAQACAATLTKSAHNLLQKTAGTERLQQFGQALLNRTF